MKIVCFLLLAFCTVSFGGRTVCEGKARGHFKLFSKEGIEVNFPCKYYALKRQQCGKYRITLTPGGLWLDNNYYWNTMWLGIVDSTNGDQWDGRTTNKLVVKHYNSSGDKPLFNKKGGNLETDDVFETGFVKSGKPEAFIRIKDVFQLTILPWDPYNRKNYGHPSWEFECFDKEATLNNFTDDQVCGGSIKNEVQHRAKDMFDLGKSHKDLVVYRDVFMSNVTQTDEECIEASNLVRLCEDQNRTLLALMNCMDILYKVRHASCVTSYLCSPMQAFNRCLKWGCSNETAFDKNAKSLCYDVGEAIDLCGDISGPGNITARLKDANCFNEYLTITYDD